jgi:hypothetical protein
MEGQSNPACETCRFWSTNPAELFPGYGECRRHAPRKSDPSDRVLWPVTSLDDFCGEHEPAPVTAEADAEAG